VCDGTMAAPSPRLPGTDLECLLVQHLGDSRDVERR
jgi:hypothetical protein